MPWWNYLGVGRRPMPSVLPEPPPALTSAAAPVPNPSSQFLRNTETWQNEVWNYFDNVGEFRFATYWEANMMSRVRLHAAEVIPGEDEPRRLDSGEAVDIVNALGGNAAGQAQLLSRMTIQLNVPGEGYLVGEVRNGAEIWSVRSVDEVRATRGHYEVMDETALSTTGWRPLGANAHVVRVYRPHSRWFHMADSPARAARSTLRELELVNRHIISQYLSRLASAGVIVFPDEITFPVKEEHAEAADPFMVEWIEIAATAIREPGTASSIVPIPIRVPGEYVDKIKHIDFTLEIDDSIIEKRDSAIKRLATQVNIPAEVLLGMGEVNHWGAWQLEEGALKTAIAPDAELISQALTQGYLQPRLAASGVEDPSRFVVWYDMSELTIRPDRSANAVLAYDRLEISGEALRREMGFDESDLPTDEELRDQGLKTVIRSFPAGAESALQQLTGEEIERIESESSPAPQEPEPEADRIEPGTQNEPPPSPSMADRRAQRLVSQSRAPHAIRFGLGGRAEVLHPSLCEQHAYSCPFTHAALRTGKFAHPGRSGVYECSLDAFGRLKIGDMSPQADVRDFLVTYGGVNGSRQ